jgi:hypothetical protein
MVPKRIEPLPIVELLLGEEGAEELMIPTPRFPQTAPIDEVCISTMSKVMDLGYRKRCVGEIVGLSDKQEGDLPRFGPQYEETYSCLSDRIMRLGLQGCLAASLSSSNKGVWW